MKLGAGVDAGLESLNHATLCFAGLTAVRHQSQRAPIHSVFVC